MMNWCELQFSNEDFDTIDIKEQEKIKGDFLKSLGVDLENIPSVYFEHCIYLDNKSRNFSEPQPMKVFLDDIKGSTYELYADCSWLEMFAKLKRATRYIKNGNVTYNKYFRMLKKQIDNKHLAVMLVKSKDGFYYIDGNGNHRVALYKMLFFSELAKGIDCKEKYWLNAMVKEEL